MPISSIIGYPIGATFFFDGNNVTLLESNDIALEGVEAESSKDNRHLLDRSDNQCLTPEEIQSLKSTGSTGNVSFNYYFLKRKPFQEIISKLVENSATFKLKTKYSQEKYLKKKKKSYLFVFTVRPYSSRAITDMLCDSGKYKST